MNAAPVHPLPSHVQFLADTSALTHMRFPAVANLLGPLIMAGRVATCGIVDMEMLFSAQTYSAVVAIRRERAIAYPRIPMGQHHFDRALDVMEQLAAAHLHRSAKMPDLLIAAVAEGAGLTVLHYDADFDHIARITKQPVRWVAPPGTV